MVWLMALPTWIKVAAGAVIVIGLLQFQHWITVRGLRQDIAELTMALDKERTAVAEFRVALADVQRNRDKLEATIRDQNASIAEMQARARQIEAAANLRVARAVRATEEAADKLRSPQTRIPPGHADMNSWLQGRLGA